MTTPAIDSRQLVVRRECVESILKTAEAFGVQGPGFDELRLALQRGCAPGFSDLEMELSEAPATWVPALLRALVKTAVRKSVFKPNGLITFVVNAERDAT